MNLKNLIKEEIAKHLLEGSMSQLDVIAHEIGSFEEFVKAVKSEFPSLASEISKPEVIKFLQGIYDDAKLNSESVITEAATKTILGVQFNVVPAQAGIKFVFKNVEQFRKSGISVNSLVAEITKMLDSKFGKGLFAFMPSGRDQTDPKVNGLEFRMSASNFFKGL